MFQFTLANTRDLLWCITAVHRVNAALLKRTHSLGYLYFYDYHDKNVSVQFSFSFYYIEVSKYFFSLIFVFHNALAIEAI